MRPLINQLANRAVGTVEEVSAGRIIVLLDPDAPQATALNTGAPERFPRVNGYLVIPNEVGMLVGWITSVRIERLPFPRRKGIETQGLVDLPFPCRVVDLIPIGTLVWGTDRLFSEPRLECRRGVDVFPSIGDPVLIPTHCQLQAIVQGEVGQDARRIQIGVCPIAANAPVYVDPDKMFGRHLAVLGNTGSGKSCSVAGLIRWSLEAAKEERQRQGGSGSVNARFIILDPNGEYASAFKDQPSVRLFQVKITEGDHSLSTRALKVPAWLWNGEEWAAFTDAAPGVQKPILFEALRRLRADDPSVRVRILFSLQDSRMVRTTFTSIPVLISLNTWEPHRIDFDCTQSISFFISLNTRWERDSSPNLSSSQPAFASSWIVSVIRVFSNGRKLLDHPGYI
ncbi:MAG TPA: ATP-binding protein [Firmicutes bacterium]|nr:ATP-binding protein [Candidatus Fermentithermobacillaceae bacterium]